MSEETGPAGVLAKFVNVVALCDEQRNPMAMLPVDVLRAAIKIIEGPKPPAIENFDTFSLDVMDALAYCKEHEASIYVKAPLVGTDGKENFAHVETLPLCEVSPERWARYVHTWMREGRIPVRLLEDDDG